MQRVLGTVTIGQAPRVDVIPEITEILGEDMAIREAGALDGLTKEEIARLAPEKGDHVLVTRLEDGSSVQVAERHIAPRIAERIEEHFALGIEVVLLLCTGEFPSFEEKGLLLRPQKVLFNAVAAVGEGQRLGILTPSADQKEHAEKRWKKASSQVDVVSASPYVDPLDAVRRAAEQLRIWGTQLSVMDCIGYTREMQTLVRDITGKPVILARGIAARTVRELLG